MRHFSAWSIGLVAVLVGAGGRAAPAPSSPPDSLPALMRLLSESGPVRARFRESKHLAILTEPLESEGALYFDPPDRFARLTTRPEQTRLVIRGDELSFRDGLGTDRIVLAESDVARQFVDNIMTLFRGDLEELESRYRVAFSANADAWSLTLTPRARVMRALIAEIRVRGRGNHIDGMEMREPSGDRTVTEFTEVETGRAFTPAELESLFTPDGAAEAP